MSLSAVTNCISEILDFKRKLKNISVDILNGSPNYDDIVQVNCNIQKNLDIIHEHQSNHTKINDLCRQIFSISEHKVNEIDDLQKDYKEAVETLREIEYLKSLKVPQFESVNDFVNECARVSIFTSGPPVREKFKSGLPFPSEEMMQISSLYNLQPTQPIIEIIDEVVPEISKVTRPESSSDEDVIDLDL